MTESIDKYINLQTVKILTKSRLCIQLHVNWRYTKKLHFIKLIEKYLGTYVILKAQCVTNLAFYE